MKFYGGRPLPSVVAAGSLVSIKSLSIIPDPLFYAQSSVTSTLDATGERLGNIVQIAKAGTIKKISFRTGTVTAGDTMKISIQGVGADGMPDGNIAASGTVVVASTDDNTWKTVEFATGVPVIQGQFIAIVLQFNSYVAGNMLIRSAQCTASPYLYNSYFVSDISASPGTWAKGPTTGATYLFPIEYDDGSYGRNYVGGIGLKDAENISSASTPDEVGNYFKALFPTRAVGFWFFGDIDYNVGLSLLDSENTILANATFDATKRLGTTGVGHFIAFDADPAANVILVKDSYYRIVITPGADAVAIPTLTVPSAAAMDQYSFGQDCVWTQRTDGGTWSQTATKRAMIGLVIDQLYSS